jgi:hypothetical protein
MFYRSTTNVDSIHPSELEIKDTTDSSAPASYLDSVLKINWYRTIFTLNIDAGGKLTTQLYVQKKKQKRDDFNFAIVNFLHYATTSHYHLHMAYISLN